MKKMAEIERQRQKDKSPAEYRRAIGHLVVDTILCSGCRTCMAICSLSHTGVSHPELSRIQVMGFLREGNLIQAAACLQCQVPKCLSACPEGAIYIDNNTGARVIETGKCTGCRLCIEACPNKAKSPVNYCGEILSPIRYDPDNKVCVKCDLCGGVPLCVKHCPMNALRLEKKEA